MYTLSLAVPLTIGKHARNVLRPPTTKTLTMQRVVMGFSVDLQLNGH